MATVVDGSADLDRLALGQAKRFHRCYRLLLVVAAPRAVLLYLRLRLRSPAGMRWLIARGYHPWRAAYAIATGRLVRRVLRTTGCRPSPAVVLPAEVPAGCVIAFFHTAWDLAIARELRERQCCLIRAGPSWAADLGRQYLAWDAAGVRSLVRRVAGGARCAAAADDFIAGADRGFFGTSHAMNPVVVRLAAITGTPLLTLWPKYERGVVRFDVGTPIAASTCAERPDEALRSAQAFFEDAVARDATGWTRIVFFLESVLAAV
jgi:hypothetical protein